MADAYLPSLDDLLAIASYRFRVEQTCLEDAGYPVGEVEPPEYPAFVQTQVQDRVSRNQLYGFFDTDNVEKFGYARLPDFPGQVDVSGPRDVPPTIARSCMSAGVQAVSETSWNDLPAGGPQSAADDARVIEARNAWSACLGQLGYKASDPLQLWTSHLSTDTADIAIASADVRCKIATNFVGIAIAVQNEYDERYIAAHQADLASYRANLQALVETAKAATR